MLNKVLNNYNQLADYCDNFWQNVYSKYSRYINCKAGCSICCELQTVNAIEAYIITSNINSFSTDKSDSKCPFLKNDRCTIYKIRPVICRTHGLVLKSNDFKDSFAISCPYNFQAPELELDSDYILDSDSITINLVKLNMAFCTVTGLDTFSSKRFSLHNIASGIDTGQFLKIHENFYGR